MFDPLLPHTAVQAFVRLQMTITFSGWRTHAPQQKRRYSIISLRKRAPRKVYGAQQLLLQRKMWDGLESESCRINISV